MERKTPLPSPEYLLLSLITSLAKQDHEHAITLQSYLENLRWLARRWSEHDALPFAEFVELLCLAFVPATAREASHGSAVYTFIAWERRITQQIRDLTEMRESGMLDQVHHHACVAAPRGNRWHNFDPCSYLECAVMGAFGEWQGSHDATGSLRSVTWREFGDFLSAGQGHGWSAPLLRDRGARYGAHAAPQYIVDRVGRPASICPSPAACARDLSPLDDNGER